MRWDDDSEERVRDFMNPERVWNSMWKLADEAVRERSDDVNAAIEGLVRKAGVNGLEVGLGFSTEGFYAFLIDPSDGEAITVTKSFHELNRALIRLSIRLDGLLAQFPERRT